MLHVDDFKDFSSGSETNSQLNEQTLAHIQTLKDAFQQIDKDLDSVLTSSELLSFLDNRMKSGQFDRNIATKLFSYIDKDNKGEISVQDFIKGYIFLEEDIKKTLTKFQKKYNEVKKMNDELANKCMESQNEKINSEGLSDKSKITLIFSEIEVLSNREQYQIFIVETNYIRETKEIDIDLDNQTVLQLDNKEIEFILTSLKEAIHFSLKGANSDNEEQFTLGTIDFNLDSLDKQESYEVEIEIPELEDKNNTVARLKVIVKFYWSDYFNYSEQKKASDELLENIQKALNKSVKYLQMLSEPLSIQTTMNPIQKDPLLEVKGSKQHENQKTTNLVYNSNNMYNEQNVIQNDNEVIDSAPASPALAQLENLIKSSFNRPHVKWPIIIKLSAVAISVLSILNMFYRGDFPSFLGGLSILWIMFSYLNPKKSPEKKKQLYQNILYIGIGLLVYDMIWFLIEITNLFSGIDQYTGGSQNGLFRFTLLITFISILTKTVLVLSLLIQRSKLERSSSLSQ